MHRNILKFFLYESLSLCSYQLDAFSQDRETEIHRDTDCILSQHYRPGTKATSSL